MAHLTGLKEKDFKESTISTANTESFTQDLINFLLERYDVYRKQTHEDVVKSAEKWLVLETIDQAWKQQMLNLDHLKEGIGLRGWGQKTPLIEYKREAFDMFREMMTRIRFDIIHHIFNINTINFDARELEARKQKELEEIQMIATEDSDKLGSFESDATIQPEHSEPKIGRNEECSCGSGKKYKKCHGA